MRFEGTLKTWNDERGFGFIEPIQGGQEIFVHIKAFPRRGGRPLVDQLLSFEVESSPDGKKRAKNVERVRKAASRRRPLRESPARWGMATLFAIPAFVLVFLASSIVWRPPLVFAAVYFGLSVITFLAYALDNLSARQGRWRTPESTLHFLSLAGGWPGASSRTAVPPPQVHEAGVPGHLLGHRRHERGRFRVALFSHGEGHLAVAVTGRVSSFMMKPHSRPRPTIPDDPRRQAHAIRRQGGRATEPAAREPSRHSIRCQPGRGSSSLGSQGASGHVVRVSDDKEECLVELYWNDNPRAAPGTGNVWRIWVKREWFGQLLGP